MSSYLLDTTLVLYPRTITAAEYPLLDESNCPELAFIVDEARSLRDAIVHASTARKDAEGEYDKENAIFSMDYHTVEKVVDMDLIRKIQAATSEIALPWLIGRAKDGFFPPITF